MRAPTVPLVRNRRVLAKVIDLVAFAGFVSLGQRFGGNVWSGFALGALYLLGSDALGMTAKTWFGLGTIDDATGRRCSLSASALRNTPWLAAPLFRTAVNAFGMDGVVDLTAPTPLSVSLARGVIGVLGLGVAFTLWRGIGDGSGRHWADVLAGTRVIKASEAGTRSARTRSAASPASAHAASTTRTPGDDHDAVDFDDADDDSRPPKRRAPAGRGKAPPARDQDAVDFDDAAN